jgi:hypothetical protein
MNGVVDTILPTRTFIGSQGLIWLRTIKKARSCERALLACQAIGLSLGFGGLFLLFRSGFRRGGITFHRHIDPFKDGELRGVALALI